MGGHRVKAFLSCLIGTTFLLSEVPPASRAADVDAPSFLDTGLAV
jgi:hypothetical protein